MHTPTTPSGEISWPGIKLLMFGQDDHFRFLVRTTFRKLGVREVLSTSVPSDGPMLMRQGIDLVLVDLGEQPVTGLALLQFLRDPVGTPPRQNPYFKVPVLMVATSEEIKLIDRARLLGIEGVVPKPISGQALVQWVTDTLRDPRRLPPPPPPIPERPKIHFSKPTPRPQDVPAPVQTPFVAPPVAPPAPPAAPRPMPMPARGLATGGGTITSAPPRSLGGGGFIETAGPAPPARPPSAAGIEVASPQRATRPPAETGFEAPAAKTRPVTEEPVETLVATERDTKEERAKEEQAEAARRIAEDRRKAEERKAAQTKRKVDAEKEAEKKAAWQAELAEAGHQSRTGGDVAGLDVTAVVAEHVKWLQSKGTDGKRANFEGKDLAGADLSRTILANATLRDADLSDASLAEARLDGADLRHAVLAAADLSSANLGVASLRHANLRLANLENASLRGADLSGAALGRSKLAGADFTGATLMGADLRQADLSRVENLSQGQIEKAVADQSTRLPAGLYRPTKNEG